MFLFNDKTLIIHIMKNNIPANFGQKWTNEEDCMLLEELSKGHDVEMIATNHNRTMGGIRSRQGVIAYTMYLKNNSMEEIMDKTKLSEESIRQTILNRENYVRKPDKRKESDELKEINELKKYVMELKYALDLTLNYKGELPTELKKYIQDRMERISP